MRPWTPVNPRDHDPPPRRPRTRGHVHCTSLVVIKGTVRYNMSENEPAQMIEGRYRIVRNIAEGGMATVYEAVDERLGRTVAIKVMHTQLAKGPHREQFVRASRRRGPPCHQAREHFDQ